MTPCEPRQVCPLAWPQRAACSCCAAWLPRATRPPVYSSTMGACGCCSSSPDEPRAAWIDLLYRSCSAHRRGAQRDGAGGAFSGEGELGVDGSGEGSSPQQRLQAAHCRHVMRVFHSLREQGAAGGPKLKGASTGGGAASAVGGAAGLEALLFVSGEESGCEDAAVLGVVCGSEEQAAPLVQAVVATLGALQLELEHARCHQGALPPVASASAPSAAPEEAAAWSCPGNEVFTLALPGAALHYACRLPSRRFASAVAAAAGFEAAVKAAHDIDWVVAAALLHVSSGEDAGASDLLVAVDLALRRRGASEVEVSAL